MTAVITLDEAKERIRKLAEERPDFVYERVEPYEAEDYAVCLYFDKANVPSCIVGHAFADELRAKGVDYETRASVSGLALRGYLDAEVEALDFLDYVQQAQDAGVPWGQAYQDALHLSPEG